MQLDDEKLPMTPEEAYKILNVGESADVEEIEEAWIHLRAQFHPELNKKWIATIDEAGMLARTIRRAKEMSGLILEHPLPPRPPGQVYLKPLPQPEPPTEPPPPPLLEDEHVVTHAAIGFVTDIGGSYFELMRPIFLVIFGLILFVWLLNALL